MRTMGFIDGLCRYSIAKYKNSDDITERLHRYLVGFDRRIMCEKHQF